MPNADWYYAVQGEQRGPVTFETLQAMASSGQLQRQDLVWHEGMSNWQAAESIEHLFAPPRPGYAPAYPQHPPPHARWPGGASPLEYRSPSEPHVYYGGFWIRVLAAIIDSLVIMVGSFCMGACFGGILGLIMGLGGAPQGDIERSAGLLGNFAGILVNWLYEALMTSSAKQATLGKMAVGIIVVGAEGERITFARATGRHFAKYLSSLALLVGYIMVAFTQRKQGLHDMIASTYVVYGKR